MQNPVFVIEGLDGEKTLSGSIPVYGAKNAVLPALAASLLIQGQSTFENVPGIADIPAMGRILEGLESIGRNPEAADKLFVPMLLSLAFAEAIAIYALVVSFTL
jgi:UDP-N-acetylglucosamine enolpyruvyl transferase